jgi:two-component system sensor histidine kinase RegB
MPDSAFAQINATKLVSNAVLENIRWMALFGQALAILTVQFGFGFDLPLWPCLGVIGASAAVGIIQKIATQPSDNLSVNRVFGLLVFDSVQLAVLVYWTGGLINPFAIMFLAPVTVSATVLPSRHTIGLVAVVVAMASLLTVYHQPLPWDEAMPDLPQLYIIGLWVALVLTTIFIALYAGMISRQSRNLARGLTEARLIMAQEQQMVALGSLATAAAHKLGSPLNTITLIAHELSHLDPKKDYAAITEDLALLKTETERCRQILAELNQDAISLGEETDDPMPITALVSSLLDNRFEDIRSQISITGEAMDDSKEPMVIWRPDLLHSLETLVDNAGQFTQDEVRIAITWDDKTLTIQIDDDGPGFQSSILSRLGEPYNSSRGGNDGHMGLGVFIAKTMVENLGGRVQLVNRKGGGARVTVIYPRHSIDSAGTRGNRSP